MGGGKASPATIQARVSTWYGFEVPADIDYIGDETVHGINTANPQWRCWWYKKGKMDYITLDANLPREERILTTIAVMRMSDGNSDKGEGGSPP